MIAWKGKIQMTNGIFNSSVSGTPAVSAQGTDGADGIDATTDNGTAVSAVCSGSGPGGGLLPTGTAIIAVGPTGISATSNASQAINAFGVHAVGAGATAAEEPPVNQAAIFAEGGPGPGVYATSDGSPAVCGTGTTGAAGVTGSSDSGIGVHAVGGGATAAEEPPVNQAAIFAEGGPGPGVYASSGGSNGVQGESSSPGDSGVWGDNSAGGTGVAGSSTSGIGVGGSSITGNGVTGQSAGSGSSGVWGNNTGGGTGVAGSSTSGTGVGGSSDSGPGVYASSQDNSGLVARSQAGFGVSASSESAPGVSSFSQSSSGVYAESGSGTGVYAVSDTSGVGVFAQSQSGIGVHAVGGGASPAASPPVSQAAIFAEGGPGTGVYGSSQSGTGITADGGSGGVALQVIGKVEVRGDSVGSATMAAGTKTLIVPNAAATTNSLIFLMPLDNPQEFLWISARDAGSFTINASKALPVKTTIMFLIIN